MPIENRNLTKGTKLTGRYHKQSYSCEVVENAEGKLRYRLEDGREFKSPSAAGMAITGHACDGWVFWSVQTEENCNCTGCRESGSCCLRQRPNTQSNQTCGLRRKATPRKPESFSYPIRRVCRKARFGGSAGTAARASLHRQSKCPGFVRQSIRPAKTT